MSIVMRFSPLVISAGILSGALFVASVYGVAGGLLLMHGSIFPLFLLGLSRGYVVAARAMVIAFIITLFATTLSDSLVFLLLIELPALYLMAQALKYQDGVNRNWYSILAIISDYTLVFSGLFIALCVIGQRTEVSELIAPIMQQFEQSANPQIQQQDPDMARVLRWLVHEGRFLLVAWTGWIWIMLSYGFACLANGILARRGLALRPSLALTPQSISPWLLIGLGIATLCITLGHGIIKLEGQAVFLLLLLPYFLSGMAWIHAMSRSWRARALWLTFIYGSLLVLLWPLVIVIGIGLYIQLSDLFKHVPKKT